MRCTVGKAAEQASQVCVEVHCTVGKAVGKEGPVRAEVLGTQGMWLRHSGPGHTKINEHELTQLRYERYVHKLSLAPQVSQPLTTAQ